MFSPRPKVDPTSDPVRGSGKAVSLGLRASLYNAEARPAYRPDIDGLRALAVTAVIAFHAFPEYLPGGFVGVDVFFVISGFLISSIIFRQLSRAAFTLTDFYTRRARRILPALCLVLATCLVFGFYALLPGEFAHLAKQAAAASAFAANLELWRENGYFAPAAQVEPLLHLWSLGIEEQFYLLWPLLLLLAWKRKRNLVRMIGWLTVASFALNLVLVETSVARNFYFPLSRFWELGLGCLLAAIKTLPERQIARIHRRPYPWLPTAFPSIAEQLPVIGVALIVTAAFAFNTDTAFPGVAALLPTVGAMCVIASSGTSWFTQRVLARRGIVFIGLISYPLYLWHWPILSFANILHSGPPDIAIRAGGVLLSFVLAVVTYRFIELPVRTQRGLRVSVALGSSVAALGIIGLGIYMQSGFPERFGTHVLAINEGPKLDALCLASVSGRHQFNYCRRTSALPPEVVFLGDSQAQAVYEGTVSVLGENYPLLLLGHGGCPPLINVRKASHVGYESDDGRRRCNNAWTAYVGYVRDTRPLAVVLVGAGSRFFVKPDPSRKRTARDAKADQRAFRYGLTTLVETLQQYSRVIYMLEIPTFDTPPTCVLRPIKLPGDRCSPWVSRAAITAARYSYVESVRDVQRDHPGMIVVDPIPSLCSASTCSQQARSGQILYSDRMHLSPAGSLQVAQKTGLARFLANSMTFEHRTGRQE